MNDEIEFSSNRDFAAYEMSTATTATTATTASTASTPTTPTTPTTFSIAHVIQSFKPTDLTTLFGDFIVQNVKITKTNIKKLVVQINKRNPNKRTKFADIDDIVRYIRANEQFVDFDAFNVKNYTLSDLTADVIGAQNLPVKSNHELKIIVNAYPKLSGERVLDKKYTDFNEFIARIQSVCQFVIQLDPKISAIFD